MASKGHFSITVMKMLVVSLGRPETEQTHHTGKHEAETITLKQAWFIEHRSPVLIDQGHRTELGAEL